MDMNFSRAETGPGHLAISRAIADLSSGDPVIITGAADGPFMMIAASGVTPQGINLMAAHARGLVGMVISSRRAAALGLEMQPRSGRETAPHYTRSIEAAQGTTTGISAEDRALTIRAAAFGGPISVSPIPLRTWTNGPASSATSPPGTRPRPSAARSSPCWIRIIRPVFR